jgi:hypothetical protein
VCGDIKFAVVTRTTISCSLSRQYRPMLSLYFLYVYGGYLQNFLDVKQNKTLLKTILEQNTLKNNTGQNTLKIILKQNTLKNHTGTEH